MKYPCVIPTVVEDYLRLRTYVHTFFERLPIDSIVFVGPSPLEEHVQKDKQDKLFGCGDISFVNETDLVSMEALKIKYESLAEGRKDGEISKIGWYYQQFLKMAYATICDAEYYLCWDADTVPCKKVDMLDANKIPYLDVKDEYQETYFLTIERLFGFGKALEKSFVTEHMLFKTEYMLEMIEEIRGTGLQGDAFYEKILSAAGKDNMRLGFSEFETYGTWIARRHPKSYRLRNWKSFRNTNFFVDINELTEDDMDWLAKDYDAATFEKYQKTMPFLTELFRNEHYREKLSPEQFYVAILEEGVFGDYEDGKIKKGNYYFPV